MKNTKEKMEIIGQFKTKKERGFLRKLDARVFPPEQKGVLLGKYIPKKKNIRKGEKVSMDFEINLTNYENK